MSSPVSRLSVRLLKPPVTPAVSAAFYQAEEEALEVLLIHDDPRPHFYSALEGPSISLQCDKAGRLIHLQVRKPRRLWIGEKGVAIIPSPPADIRFLDFRSAILEPEFLCDSKRERLLAVWGSVHSSHCYHLADNIFAFVRQTNELTGLYIDCIRDDRAGQLQGGWRNLVAEGSSIKPPWATGE